MRLQGFPENYIINVPYSQLRKIAGNSVTVPVIKLIAHQMIESLKEQRKCTNRFEQIPMAV